MRLERERSGIESASERAREKERERECEGERVSERRERDGEGETGEPRATNERGLYATRASYDPQKYMCERR